MLAVLRSDQNGKHSTFLLVHGTLHPIHANPLEVIVLLSLYLAVLDDQSNEEQFIDVYNTYKRLVYHTAYKIMGDSYLAEDVLQEVFLYVAKNFSKIHRENCHELAAWANKSCLKVVPQDLFSRLTVLLIHGQKEHGQHDCHHAKGSTRVACGVPQNKEQRHAYDCRCTKTDKLPGGQVEGYFGLHLAEIARHGNISCQSNTSFNALRGRILSRSLS